MFLLGLEFIKYLWGLFGLLSDYHNTIELRHYQETLIYTSHKYIHMHIKQEFMTWSYILAQVTWTFMDTYGPWPVYVLDGLIFLILLYVFPYYFHPKDITISPHHWCNFRVEVIQWLKKLSQCLNTFSYMHNIIGNKLCNILSIFLRQPTHNTYKLSQTLWNLMRIWLHCWWFKMVIHQDSFLAFNFSVFFVL